MGSFCCDCCYWSSSSKSSNSYCKYTSPLSPCSSWSCYVPCPCCHGFVAHHGLTTHGGLDVMVLLLIRDVLLAMVLFCVFGLYVPSCDVYLYFVRPCSCRGHALLHQFFFWEIYRIKYGFTLGEMDFLVIKVVVHEVGLGFKGL